jgi:iron-sulfur cluster insertion protein
MSEATLEEAPALVEFTPEAAERAKRILDEEDSGGSWGLRLFVQGGGCQGFSYGFTIAEESEGDDWAIDLGDGRVCWVDSMSAQYLRGAVVRFRVDANGEAFAIENPNAVSTCGCGSSFAA